MCALSLMGVGLNVMCRRASGTAGGGTVVSGSRKAGLPGLEPTTRIPLQWLTPSEAATVEAICERIIPGSPKDPGARDAEVVIYIDRALAGPYATLQTFYRLGLAYLNQHARALHGASFAALSPEVQDEILRDLEAGVVSSFPLPGEEGEPWAEPTAATFFAVIRQHTIEGMFADPMYGGNKHGAGWRLIGYPGPRYGYTRDEMRLGADLSTRSVTTLADLRDVYDRGEDRDPAWAERQ
jgi:gluconate 2-dehydrogenase gamma chain